MSQFIFCLKNTVHISDGLSVRRQERNADCLLACSQQFCLIYACFCMYSHDLLMMDAKTARNM